MTSPMESADMTEDKQDQRLSVEVGLEDRQDTLTAKTALDRCLL